MGMPFGRDNLAVPSLVCGILLTTVFTSIAFMIDSRVWACIFVWQECLLQVFIHGPAHEGTPVDGMGFVLGVLLGIPIYSVLTHIALERWEKANEVD
jgi:hypothetical protein